MKKPRPTKSSRAKAARKRNASRARTQNAVLREENTNREPVDVLDSAVQTGSKVSSEMAEAARILKSAGSKKRERKAAAAVMSTTGGAKRGGENRAKNLTPEQRRDIARLGGLARQQKAREEDERLGFTLPRNKTLTRREIRLKSTQNKLEAP